MPELSGCHMQGDSMDGFLENVRGAIKLYLETLSEDEKRDS